MKLELHPIFKGKYKLYWLIIAIVVFLKFMIFGLNTKALVHLDDEGHSLTYWGFAAMFCGFIYASPFYLVYRLFSKKWNNDVYIFLIYTFTLIVLTFII